MDEEQGGTRDLGESGMHDPPEGQEARPRPLHETGEFRQPQWAKLEAYEEGLLRQPSPSREMSLASPPHTGPLWLRWLSGC